MENNIFDLPNLLKDIKLEQPSVNESVESPKDLGINLQDMLKNAPELNKNTVSSALDQIQNNPDLMSGLVGETLNNMSPELMEQAKKLVQGGQGDSILKEMKKKGIDPKALKKEILSKRKLNSKVTGPQTKIVMMNTGRQVKTKSVPKGISYSSLIDGTPVLLSCSRLAQGPLSGKSVKVWYDAQNKTRNRRASKIIGFPVGGEFVFFCEEGDLIEKDFAEAESLLE